MKCLILLATTLIHCIVISVLYIVLENVQNMQIVGWDIRDILYDFYLLSPDFTGSRQLSLLKCVLVLSDCTLDLADEL